MDRTCQGLRNNLEIFHNGHRSSTSILRPCLDSDFDYFDIFLGKTEMMNSLEKTVWEGVEVMVGG